MPTCTVISQKSLKMQMMLLRMSIEHWHCENCGGLPRHMHPRPPVAKRARVRARVSFGLDLAVVTEPPITKGGSATGHQSGGWGGHWPTRTEMPQLTTGKGKEAMEDPVDPQLIQDAIQPDGMIDPPRRIRTPRKKKHRVRDGQASSHQNYATLPERGPSQMPEPNHNRCKQPAPPHCPLAVVNMLSTVVIIKRCPGMWF